MIKMKELNQFLSRHKRSVLLISTLVLVVVLVINLVVTNSVLNAGEQDAEAVSVSNINPKYNELMKKGAIALSDGSSTSSTIASTAEKKEEKKATSAATSSTTAPATTQPPSSYTDENVPFATAVPAASPADYQSQWDQGFLVAIDNPDPSYSCPHISLTDDDRDLLERLCMGEFGSGGFIGAALIAQCVKDAMCFDGYATVADVIQYCRYDGSTDIGTNDACRQAVRYVFDDNCDAVQHRIMYMYNPYMVKSAFHESQNFILSYQGVRFFDRWGY